MKKILIIAAFILALTSCSIFEDIGEKVSYHFFEGEEVSINVNFPASQTRSVISLDADNDLICKWSKDDRIKVTVYESSTSFVLKSGEGKSEGVFSGKMPTIGTMFSVQYPCDEPDLTKQLYAGKDTIPVGMMKFTAVSCRKGMPVSLAASSSILKLNLWGGQTVGKIVVTDMSSAASPKPTYTLTITGGKEIGSSSSEATPFCIVVPAGEFQFSAEVFDNNGTHIDKVMSKQTFEAGKIKNMPALRLAEGALPAFFSVSADKKVRFSKGNLYYNGSTWNFENNQYDYRTYGGKNSCIDGSVTTNGTQTNHWGLFGWSTSSTTNGMKISTENSDYSGDFNDWGKNPIANGGNFENLWRTLSSAEWTYLLNTNNDASGARTQTNRFAKAKVKGVNGLLIFPDGYNGTTEVTGIDGIAAVNNATASYPATQIELSAWSSMESVGCVFLPAGGYRGGSNVNSVGGYGFYWSSTAINSGDAFYLDFGSSCLYPAAGDDRCYGTSVRLVIAAQ